ncbi:GNAT family N-acetyltransferase, variant 2 [Balamuthia mandrillaris]
MEEERLLGLIEEEYVRGVVSWHGSEPTQENGELPFPSEWFTLLKANEEERILTFTNAVLRPTKEVYERHKTKEEIEELLEGLDRFYGSNCGWSWWLFPSSAPGNYLIDVISIVLSFLSPSFRFRFLLFLTNGLLQHPFSLFKGREKFETVFLEKASQRFFQHPVEYNTAMVLDLNQHHQQREEEASHRHHNSSSGGFEVKPVSNAEEAKLFGRLLALGFGFSSAEEVEHWAAAHQIMWTRFASLSSSSPSSSPTSYDALIGYLDDKPVSVGSCASLPQQACFGISSIATLPEARGRGYASRLMQTLIARRSENKTSKAEPPCFVLLAASEGSRSVYSKLGFRDICSVPIFTRRTTASTQTN